MALHGHMSLIGSVKEDDGVLSLEGSPEDKRQLTRGKTVKIAKSRRRDKRQQHDLSFNSSDVEAYRHENPIPVLKQAYTDYQRKKRKALMRRAQTSDVTLHRVSSELQGSM